MVWLDPWGGSREKKHAGEGIGCELALRHLKNGDQEVYVKDMTAGGPGALSGQLAIGDAIEQINGTDPLDASSGVAKSLVKLVVQGETGTPVWLRIKGVRKHVVLIQRAPLCLKPAPASSTAGLGFTFQEQRTAEGVEVVVIEIKEGGAIWLAGRCDEEVIFVGDVITHVDGKRTTGNAAQFKGAQFSRVCLAGRRGRDASCFEIKIVRIATLPTHSLEMVSAYRASVACCPPAPPSDRVNASAATDECLDALTINGITIKTAAKIVVAAYKLQEQSPSQTPQKAAPTPSRFPSPSTHPKSPSKQSAPSAFPSPSIHPKSPSKQCAPSAFPGRRQAAAKCADVCAGVHCLTPMSPLALVKDAAHKTDVTDQQETQGEQGIGESGDEQGEQGEHGEQGERSDEQGE
jgi:hypothetical protein